LGGQTKAQQSQKDKEKARQDIVNAVKKYRDKTGISHYTELGELDANSFTWDALATAPDSYEGPIKKAAMDTHTDVELRALEYRIKAEKDTKKKKSLQKKYETESEKYFSSTDFVDHMVKVAREELDDSSSDFETDIVSFMNTVGFENPIGTKKDGAKVTETIKLELPNLGKSPTGMVEHSDGKTFLQIDSAGTINKKLFVVECKLTMTRKQRYTGIQGDFEHHKTRIELIKEQIKNPLPSNEKHVKKWKDHEIVPVFALRNIRLGDAELSKARKMGIQLWDDNFVAYYSELSDAIGVNAMWDMLGDMGIEMPSGDPPQSTFCIRTNINLPEEYRDEVCSALYSKKFNKLQKEFSTAKSPKKKKEKQAEIDKVTTVPVFQFLMDPRDLLKIATVARRNKPGEYEHYQRMVDGDRLDEIAEYMSHDYNIAPNNIVIGMEGESWKDAGYSELQSKIKLAKDARGRQLMADLKKRGMPLQFGTLTFPRKYRSCWIIDGQHRLYGIAHQQASSTVPDNKPMPIIAFGNLPHRQMGRMFLTINDKQKKIDPDLKYDLYSVYYPEEPHGLISRTIKQIDGVVEDYNGSSCLSRRIFYPSLGMGNIDRDTMIPIASMFAALKSSKLLKEDSKFNHILGKRGPKQSKEQWNAKAMRDVASSIGQFYDILKQTYPKQAKNETGFIFYKSTCKVLLPMLFQITADCGNHDNNGKSQILTASTRKTKLTRYVKAMKPFFEEMTGDDDEAKNLLHQRNTDSSRGTQATQIQMEMAEAIRQTISSFGGRTEYFSGGIIKKVEKIQADFGRLIHKTFPPKNQTKNKFYWRQLFKSTTERGKKLDAAILASNNVNQPWESLDIDDIHYIIVKCPEASENLNAIAAQLGKTKAFRGDDSVKIRTTINDGIKSLNTQVGETKRTPGYVPSITTNEMNKTYIKTFSKALTEKLATFKDEEDPDE
jgi:DGQHR domain-containing protein